jgi:hypothetical protein
MNGNWMVDEIAEHYTLLNEEHEFVKANAAHNRLGQAILLKFFQYQARFPEDRKEIPLEAVEYIAHQLGLSPQLLRTISGKVEASKASAARFGNCLVFAQSQ